MTKNDAQIPLIKMHEWMEVEKNLGSANPDRVVLATCSPENIPHSRIVAIREITSDGILFFTQRSSRKVAELRHNPYASMTLWLALQQRQIILDGIVKPLTSKENEKFWSTLPRERQLRFSACAPTSGQVIDSLSVLEYQIDALTKQFLGEEIPMHNHYCGFHLIVETMYFYTLGDNSFSELFKYKRCQNAWDKQLVSP
jgi:pyridoxamine 5'-phosphate oxidase